MNGHKKKKGMNFQSKDELKEVYAVIDDANKALNDKSRTMKDSPIGETLSSVVEVGTMKNILAASASLPISDILSRIKVKPRPMPFGWMIAGPLVLPFTIHFVTDKELRQAKELVYKDAIAKQTEIIDTFEEERNEQKADKDRIEYLLVIIKLLSKKIEKLEEDLGKR